MHRSLHEPVHQCRQSPENTIDNSDLCLGQKGTELRFPSLSWGLCSVRKLSHRWHSSQICDDILNLRCSSHSDEKLLLLLETFLSLYNCQQNSQKCVSLWIFIQGYSDAYLGMDSNEVCRIMLSPSGFQFCKIQVISCKAIRRVRLTFWSNSIVATRNLICMMKQLSQTQIDRL